MTIPSTPFRKDHTLTGAIVPLLYDWKILSKNHLLVTLVDTVSVPNVETTLTVDTDYTVNNVGSDTGTITPALAYTAGWKIVITPNLPFEQDTDFTNQNSVKPEEAESMADKLGRQIKQIVETLSRTVKTTVGGGVQPDDLLDSINAAVTLSGTNATTSTTQAGIATTQAGIATTQAGIATAAVEGIPYRDVVFLTFANSPYTMTNADRGKMFSIDTSGGNFVFNLAQISTLTMPFTIGVKKATNDANTVTINRAGTDLIDAATSYVISNVAVVNLIGDTDGTPDKWTSAAFGAGAGEIKNQTFTGGVDYTAGSTTTLTLTNTPIAPSSAALDVIFDGVYQHPSEWSYNPGTGVITFTSAIPLEVAKVFTQWTSSSVVIGTPSDGTVSWIKLASALIASVAEIVSGTANKIVSAANLRTFINENVTTPWVAYTPVFTGFGTVTNIDFYSRRVGSNLEVMGRCTNGTPTATEARMTIGFNGTSGNVTAVNGGPLPASGTAIVGVASMGQNSDPIVLAERNVSYVTFGLQSNGTGGLIKLNGSVFIGTSLNFTLKASIPIQGW